MDRRKVLASTALGTLFLAGCSTQGVQPASGLTIQYESDKQPDVRRAIAVTIGSYDWQEKFDSETEPPNWGSEVAFEAVYRLTPDETVKPDIFVGEPGTYRFDVWVQKRGGIGTQVEITEDGTLAETHTVSITADGMSHHSS